MAEERLAASEADLAAWEPRLRDREAELEARESRLQEREVTEQDEQQEAISLQERAATRKAISRLEDAEEAGGGEALGEARRFLEGGPCAQRAANALMAIAGDAIIKRTGAARAVRDVVVLRCSSPATLGDRSAFREAAEGVFGRPLGLELWAQLLLAHGKVFKKGPS